MNCGTCQFCTDLRGLNMSLLCMNKKNSPSPGDFKIIANSSELCDFYVEFKIENKFEWDENKNRKNIEKHGVAFERIYDLYCDEKLLQMVEKPEKWENLSKLDESVERNEGNIDPIRGKLIGKIDRKLFTAIYTFRDEIGKMRYRIISLRRSDKSEIKTYEKMG